MKFTVPFMLFSLLVSVNGATCGWSLDAPQNPLVTEQAVRDNVGLFSIEDDSCGPELLDAEPGTINALATPIPCSAFKRQGDAQTAAKSQGQFWNGVTDRLSPYTGQDDIDYSCLDADHVTEAQLFSTVTNSWPGVDWKSAVQNDADWKAFVTHINGNRNAFFVSAFLNRAKGRIVTGLLKDIIAGKKCKPQTGQRHFQKVKNYLANRAQFSVTAAVDADNLIAKVASKFKWNRSLKYQRAQCEVLECMGISGIKGC